MWEVYEFLARGGPVMIPIALGSVTGLAIFFERLWALRRSGILPPSLLERVRKLVSTGKPGEALAACQKVDAPLARVLATCLRYRDLGRTEIKGAIEDVGRREVAGMSRFLGALGAIASVSPLLGLLGTVTGMIQAFRQVVASGAQGAIDPTRLASGIWEALITTAAGLSVAIPCFVGYKYLASRADRMAVEMEGAALQLLDVVTGVVPPDEAGATPEEASTPASEEA